MDTVQQPVDASDRNERDPQPCSYLLRTGQIPRKNTGRVQTGFKFTKVMIVIIQESKDLSLSPRA